VLFCAMLLHMRVFIYASSTRTESLWGDSRVVTTGCMNAVEWVAYSTVLVEDTRNERMKEVTINIDIGAGLSSLKGNRSRNGRGEVGQVR